VTDSPSLRRPVSQSNHNGRFPLDSANLHLGSFHTAFFTLNDLCRGICTVRLWGRVRERSHLVGLRQQVGSRPWHNLVAGSEPEHDLVAGPGPNQDFVAASGLVDIADAIGVAT
jgi:hypothetical protein